MSAEQRCGWFLISICEGQVLQRTIFGGEIKYNGCDKHFAQHKKVMLLCNKNIRDMDECLNLSVEKLDKLLAENNLNIDDMTEKDW